MTRFYRGNPTGDPAAMLEALGRGDRAAALEAALEAALQAYFGPPLYARSDGLPAPLAALFTRFLPGIVQQNALAIPDRDSRIFYVENQSCNHWALGSGADDPPVVRDGSVVENELLSGFAIQLVLFEASMGALDCGAGGFFDSTRRADFLSPLVEVPLQPWTWPNSARFYVGSGIVAHADLLAPDEVWVFATATTEEPLRQLEQQNGIEWSMFDAVGGDQ